MHKIQVSRHSLWILINILEQRNFFFIHGFIWLLVLGFFKKNKQASKKPKP